MNQASNMGSNSDTVEQPAGFAHTAGTKRTAKGLARRLMIGLTMGVLVTQLAARGWAQDPARGPAPAAAPTMADFAKLQTEVREQRQLIMEMLQAEQQRYDMLLKLIRVQSGGMLPEAAQQLLGAAQESGKPAPAAEAAPAAKREAAEVRRSAISGRVSVGGGDASEVYVYVENVRGAPARGKSLEIKQENKQFSPRTAVVQVGTSVSFPNYDAVYHNVFSNSPRNSFDLGSSRAGDKPRAVTLMKPGVVDIYCNMHQKMSANVLVVPGPLYARVRADGTFRIDNVPVGMRKVVAWSPRTKSVEQRVDVTAAGAQLTFAMEADEHKPHLNKMGQAYGSYRE